MIVLSKLKGEEMEKERKIAWLSLIGLGIVLLILLFWITSAASADTIFYGYGGPGYVFGLYGYSYSQDQVHWSVYEHKLVSGDVYYSPYAYRYGQSGLVNKEFRYSPYALKYGQTGLISQYDVRPYCSAPVAVAVQPNPSFDQIFKQETAQQKRYQENVEARRKKVEQRKRQMAERGLITKK